MRWGELNGVGNKPVSYPRMSVAGPFRLWASNGEELKVSERKGQGILALLALSEGRVRTREALVKQLWSRSDAVSGGASLRVALSKLRKELGELSQYLQADSTQVCLSFDIACDVEWPSLHCLTPLETPPILLDGLRTRDPAFDEWLSQQRTAFKSASESLSTGSTTDLRLDSANLKAGRAWVMVRCAECSPNPVDVMLERVVGETISRGIDQMVAVDVAGSLRDTPGILIEVGAVTQDGQATVHLGLRSAHDSVLLWSLTDLIPSDPKQLRSSASFSNVVNQVIDIALNILRNLRFDADHGVATVLCIEAIHKMFSLEISEIAKADQMLGEAYERSSRAVYLAWRAYLRCFYVGERLRNDVQDREEAIAFSQQALSLEPYNATVLALLSHVHSFLLRDPVLGHELAEQALRYVPSHPLAMTYFGQAKIHIGDYKQAFELSSAALAACGPGPHRYSLMFQNCMAAVANRQIPEALQFGHRAHALEPRYKPPMRYLFGLSLGEGDRDSARQFYEKIRILEPDFSLKLIGEENYPVAGLRIAGVLDNLRDDEFE